MRVGTLCSGIGAPEVSFKQLKIKHKITFASDIDTYAKKTYMKNHRCNFFFDDIYSIPDTVNKTDILIFGFPCQPFSLASAESKGLADSRGRLIFQISNILKNSKPKYFIAENVEGLVKRDKGRTFRRIVRLLRSCGYSLYYDVLNSLDFGVPQHRKRVYFVGIKAGADKGFSFDNLRRRKYKSLDKILDKEVGEKFFATKEFLEKDKVKKRLKNYDKDYAPCITRTIARNGSSSEYISQVAAVNRSICQARKPTPRECARLHGFPETFKIPDEVPITKQYEQFANTMTVPVVKEVLRELLK